MAKTMEEVLERFRTIEFHDDFDMIVAIANGGIVPAGIINQRLQKEVHLLRINLRDEYQHPKYDAPQLLAPVDFNFRGISVDIIINEHFSAIFLSYYDKITNFVPNKK